jgi:hypothetical protein
MGKGRRAHHKLDEPCREPLGTPCNYAQTGVVHKTSPITPQLQNTQSVLVEEYIGNNGGRVVRIGLPPLIVIGEELPADYDLGIETIEVKQDDDHLSQKQKAQKRGYLSWLFWR